MGDRTRALAMDTYRFFAVDEFDRIISEQSIQCSDDSDAHRIALAMATEARGVEVWDVGRRVAKLMPSIERKLEQARNLPYSW